jgi:hypothetical protein
MERQFFLQAVDARSGFIVAETALALPFVAALGSVIAADPQDPEFRRTYRLDKNQLAALLDLGNAAFDPGSHEAELSSWDPAADLPYRLHAGRELPLMLAGLKPLSYFCGVWPPGDRFVEIPEHLFDPHVETGRFTKRDFITSWNVNWDAVETTRKVRGLRTVLYALRGEEWRIDAFILLLNTAEKTGWNETAIRLEGSLLGYEEWQNDAFIAASAVGRASMPADPTGWDFLPFHAAPYLSWFPGKPRITLPSFASFARPLRPLR